MAKHRTLNLITILLEIDGPRVERTRLHKLNGILIISICALLCGAESFEDMELFGEAKEAWFRAFRELPLGILSHATFGLVFAALDPEKFLEAFMRWSQSLRETLSGEVVAIDGKALRRAIEAGQSPKVIVSAWARGQRQRRAPLLPQQPASGRGTLCRSDPQPLEREEPAPLGHGRRFQRRPEPRPRAPRRWRLNLLKAGKRLAKRSLKGRRKNAGGTTPTSSTSSASI